MVSVLLRGVAFLMLPFVVTIIMVFLNKQGLVGLSASVIGYFEGFKTFVTSTLAVLALGAWVVGFYKDGISKYRLHEISGIIGSGLFLLAFIGIILGINLFYLFLLGGILCLYCMVVPPITMLSAKFSNSKWEPALVWAVIASLNVYGMSTLSNIFINEMFGVDAKYFSHTKPIAMLIAAAPVTAIISLICLVASVFPLFTKKVTFSFYTANSFAGSFVLLIVSIAYGVNIDRALEKTAANVDFNSNHPCDVDENVTGVIFLDPTLTNVLVYNPKSEEKYSVEPCNIQSGS